MNSSESAIILAGLQHKVPYLSAKYFYDILGSTLFDAITLLDEYYPTRVEKSIMQSNRAQIAQAVGECDILIDLGAGNCAKASALFTALMPKQYHAVDISGEYLELALASVQKKYPQIVMSSQVCDLSQPLYFSDRLPQKKTFFYPGSSIGNFDPDKASEFFQNIAKICDAQGGLLIGVDLVKDHAILERAYNDALGITAAFNRNILQHINHLTGSDFRIEDWEHDAFYNVDLARIEMHLRARCDLQVTLPETALRFSTGDLIHTENSYKYTRANFIQKLLAAGFQDVQYWTDPQEQFLVCYAHF